MTRLRFSIGALMGAIVLLGLGLAALRYPNKLWASFYFSITAAVLVFAALGAVFRRGLPRAFWTGFSICGWLYFLVAFAPWLEGQFYPYLLTTAILDLIYSHVAAPEQTAVALQSGQFVYGLAGGFGGPPPVPEHPWVFWTGMDNAASQFSVSNNFDLLRSKPFQMIGHSFFALLFAYLGGVSARRFARLEAGPSAPA
jgi:hypothetical protein